MRLIRITTLTSLVAALVLAGCANDQTSGLLTTAAVPKAKKAKSAVDPTCTALMAKINAVRLEGTPGRVHKVATGKSRTVVIKRASLAKVAELDRLNAEFQQKCSKYPGLQTASAAPAPASSTRPTIAAPAQPIVSVPKQ